MAWYHWVWNVVWPGRLSRELDREMAFHLAERTDDILPVLRAPGPARARTR